MSERDPSEPAPEPTEGDGKGPPEGDGEDPAKEANRRAPRDADGMDRPTFLLDFPEDPELEVLIAAFERGNYARIRSDAERLASSTKDPAVRDAALELRRRIDPDPLAKYFLLIAVMLLVFLIVWVYRGQAR